MAVEIDASALLVDGPRLEVETRCIGVTTDDLEPRVRNLLAADYRRHYSAVFASAIDAVAWLKRLELGYFAKAAGLQQLHALGIAAAGGLCDAQILHVLFAVPVKRNVFLLHCIGLYQTAPANIKGARVTKH